ncbi:MAG: MFS transporter [Pseudomonadota bacterium]
MSEQAATPPRKRKNLRIIVAGFIGNVLEWYDFAIYGFFAATLGRLFFPADDPATSLIASFGAFAVGFVMRPLGAILFGHIGDRWGRRSMMIVSVLSMAFATCAIGLLPTDAQIGPAAAVILVVLRMVQGLSVGGEYIGSGVFLSESAPAGRRGLFASFATGGLFAGLLIGTAVGVLVSTLMTDDDIAAWGWRIPFWAGLLLGAIALFSRLKIDEPEAPDAPAKLPAAEAFRHHGGTILHATAIDIVLAANFYVTTIFVPGWLIRNADISRALSLEINALAIALSIAAGFPAAMLSDKIGRRPVLLATALLFAVLFYPMYVLIASGDTAQVTLALCVLGLLNGAYAFVVPGTFAEMFPWRVRATSANLSHNLSMAALGGTGPMIATWIVAETGGLVAVGVYLAALAVVSVIACWFLKRPRDLKPT